MVDIALAVYNGEKYLKDQLNSLFSQTFKDFRVIIGDDGSTDKTPNIVEEYSNMYKGKIDYFVNDNSVSLPKNNFYEIIKRCKSPYIMTCDQDDVWNEKKIELSLELMKSIEEKCVDRPVLVHSDLSVVDENLNVLSKSMFRSQKLLKSNSSLNRILCQNNVTGCTMMINKSLKEMITCMPKEAIMHDWWIALIAASFGKIGFLDIATVLYRQHGNNNVGAKNVRNLGFISKRLLKVEEIKKSINDTYKQAKKFLSVYKEDLSDTDKEIINRYISIPELNKLNKIKVMNKNNFYKSGVVRKIAQIIYV